MKFIALGVVCLIFFTVFSQQVRKGRFASVDFDTTVKVQNWVAKLDIQRFEGILEDIGALASPAFSMAATGVLIVWAFKKRRFAALLIPVAFALMTLAEIYGKSVVHHPAPPFFMLKNPTTIFPTYQIWEEFSYPSGHAARAVFLGFLISDIGFRILPKRRLMILFGVVVYIGLISLSRIYLGHHWLSDVIGGLILGSGFGLLTLFPTKKTADGG